MKILVLGRGIPNEEYPQEGCFEWDQAQCLKKDNHEVIYMYLDARYRKKGHQWGINESVIDGIPVYCIYMGTLSCLYRIRAYRLGDWLSNFIILKLFKYILGKHDDIDVVHSHYLGGNNRGVHLKKKCNIPVVGTEHLSDMVKPKLSSYYLRLGNKTYKYLDQLIVVSQFLQKAIEGKFKVKSIVCSNVLGKEFENIEILKSGGKNKLFTFVACGSLIPRKGFDILIEAAYKLEIPKNKWQIEIIGEGPQKKELQRKIKELILEDNIHLVGKCNKKQIRDFYLNADCFILSSKSETFGVVLIEALACGLPSIATRCGGADEIMNETSGIYVPTNDSDALANAMKEMYINYEKYDKETIRDICLSKYSSVAIAKELTKIYKKVIDK